MNSRPTNQNHHVEELREQTYEVLEPNPSSFRPDNIPFDIERSKLTGVTVPDATNLEPHKVDPRLYRSDHIPSDFERSQVLGIIQEDEGKVQRCDEEIAILQQKMEMLEGKKGAITDNIRTCRSILSAQRQVPNEIWEIIFSVLCTSIYDHSFHINYDYVSWNKPPVQDTPALGLSQVCSRWRAIALGLPCIWSSINIEFTQLFVDITPPLELYFSNAKRHPLNIRVSRETAHCEPIPFSEETLAAWRSLSQHLSRCRTLALKSPHFDLPAVQGLAFPQLESLREEEHQYGMDDDETSWFWEAIEGAPKLMTVSLWTFRGNLPLSQLRSLELQSLHTEELAWFLDALLSCGCLETLEIRTLYPHYPFARPVVMDVQVPSLRKLILGEDDSELKNDNINLVSVLSSLSLPSLVSLELPFREGFPSSLLTLAGQSPLLERMSLCMHLKSGGADAISSPFTPLFQSFPNLTHLELYVIRVATGSEPIYRQGNRPLFGDKVLSNVLSPLRIEPVSSICLPSLQWISLHLFPLSLDLGTVDKVLEVVLERHSASRPLKAFRVFRDVRQYELDEGTRIRKAVLDPDMKEKIRAAEEQTRTRIIVDDFRDTEHTEGIE
ncbi:hypothetical protein PM082_021719 [Marasmius tenuissimus]|nr:hypothetical protein PM082_021719 [Marasmius tenuissimus]